MLLFSLRTVFDDGRGKCGGGIGSCRACGVFSCLRSSVVICAVETCISLHWSNSVLCYVSSMLSVLAVNGMCVAFKLLVCVLSQGSRTWLSSFSGKRAYITCGTSNISPMCVLLGV